MKRADENAIVRNVGRLSSYIDDTYLKSEEDKFFFFESNFKAFNQQIKAVYNKWFPNAKTCSNTDIINQVFRNNIPKKDAKIWVKYSMACLLNSSERIYKNIIQAKNNSEPQLLLCEMYLLKEMSFEAAMLMQDGFDIIENKKIDFGHWKRLQIDPRETFNASRQILRKYVAKRTPGDFVFSPSSIFLIRQSIELWLQSIFGIDIATDDKNNLIKLQPDKLFDLLDNKGVKVETPVPKIVIKKIHQWTQAYVHAGWMAYTWEIEHAQYVLEPIFATSKIKIDKRHYDTIEDQLRKIFNHPSLKLHRLTRHDSVIKE